MRRKIVSYPFKTLNLTNRVHRLISITVLSSVKAYQTSDSLASRKPAVNFHIQSSRDDRDTWYTLYVGQLIAVISKKIK